MPRFRSTLLWFVLLICAFSAFADRAEAEEMLTSWYGPGLYGLPTASGEPYDAYGYTAAHKTLPLGTKLVVRCKGRSVPVTVNDRGPYVGDRALDLSEGVAQELGLAQAGVDYVEYSLAASGGYGASYPAPSVAVDAGAYIVQPGDTLSQLAARLATSTEHLAEHNDLADPDLLYSGQILYPSLPEEDHVGGGSTIIDNLAFGEEATAFDAAAADNTWIVEDPFVYLAAGSRESEPQILDGAITLDETGISESDMIGDNTSIGEGALDESFTSENEESESQMSSEGPIVSGEDLAAVAAD